MLLSTYILVILIHTYLVLLTKWNYLDSPILEFLETQFPNPFKVWGMGTQYPWGPYDPNPSVQTLVHVITILLTGFVMSILESHSCRNVFALGKK